MLLAKETLHFIIAAVKLVKGIGVYGDRVGDPQSYGIDGGVNTVDVNGDPKLAVRFVAKFS
jgi:hypothetical protein